MSRAHRVIMATDIPFWLNANGAHQRMMAIWRSFQKAPFECIVFFAGPAKKPLIDLASAKGLVVCPVEGSPVARQTSAPRRLADYHWPSAQRQFRELVRRIGPHTVVLEYVTMTYLAEVVRAAAPKARLFLDSHDVLHRRCDQFQAAGYRHWIEISAAEEAAAAARCDVILAIQDDEAAWFREAAPKARVMTVGHSFDFSRIKPVWRPLEGRPPVVGYFGSNNGSNVDAITQFIESAWPAVTAAVKQAELLVGGTIVDAPAVEPNVGMARVRMQRNFGTPASFYEAVDLVINPVRFGTGLKIKTVEALAHGRPIVTTANGSMGVSASFADACISVDGPEQMSEPVARLLAAPEAMQQLARQAHALARSEFSEERVFGDVRRLLLGEAPPNSTRPL